MENPRQSRRSTVAVYAMNRFVVEEALGNQPKAVVRQALSTIMVSFGTFAIGIGLALPTITLEVITDPMEPAHLTKSQGSWYASVNTITCPLGALLSAFFLDKIGRKKTMLMVNVFAILSWIVTAMASDHDSEMLFLQLMIARCLIGISHGMGSAPTSVYCAEICLPKMRGRLIMVVTVTISLGALLVCVLGYFIRRDFQLIALILLVFQAMCMMLLIPVHETPSYLLSKGKTDEAQRSLKFFRGLDKDQTHTEMEEEFAFLQGTVQRRLGKKPASFFKAFRLPEVYKPLLMVIGMFACQQLSASFILIVYSVQISIAAEVKIDPELSAVFICIARAAVSCMLCWLLEAWGRRSCGLVSAIGSAISLFAVASDGWFPGLGLPYLPITALILFVIFNTMGLLPLPFVLLSEVFPQKFRGPCAGISGFCGFLMCFIALKVHPTMNERMGSSNVFGFHAAMATLSIVYFYFFLPETRGKTLYEIEQYYRGTKS